MSIDNGELSEKLELEEIERQRASEVDNCEYLIDSDPYDEHGFLLSYAHKDGWAWMKHPDNPFKIKDIMRWKKKAEKLDEAEELLQLANKRLNQLAFNQTKLLTLLEQACSKCILIYHGTDCTKRECEFKDLRETLEETQ